MERIICLITGYLVGSVLQTGYWYGKLNHIDIREHGSGNAGTTNVLRTLGKKAAAVTYLVDAFKAVIAVLIVHFTFGSGRADEMLLFMYTGLGAILGHNFPFYLKFKGGKGIAATSGVVMSFMFFPTHCWTLTLIGFLTFIIITAVTRYVSLASLVAVTVFFLQFVIMGLLDLLPIKANTMYEAFAVCFVIAALAYIRHIGNIKRLASGTERKIGEKKTEA